MSKKQININKQIMTKIKKGTIKMKPKWHFVIGSLLTIVGFIGLIVLTIFLISLISFSFKTHRPMGQIRYEQMISDFPWWAIILSIFGLIAGVFMLKKYEFCYKRNLSSIVLIFVISVILAGFLIDYYNIDSLWIKKGPMNKMYQKYDGGYGKGSGWRKDLNKNKDFYKKGQMNFFKQQPY